MVLTKKILASRDESDLYGSPNSLSVLEYSWVGEGGICDRKVPYPRTQYNDTSWSSNPQHVNYQGVIHKSCGAKRFFLLMETEIFLQ